MIHSKCHGGPVIFFPLWRGRGSRRCPAVEGMRLVGTRAQAATRWAYWRRRLSSPAGSRGRATSPCRPPAHTLLIGLLNGHIASFFHRLHASRVYFRWPVRDGYGWVLYFQAQQHLFQGIGLQFRAPLLEIAWPCSLLLSFGSTAEGRTVMYGRFSCICCARMVTKVGWFCQNSAKCDGFACVRIDKPARITVHFLKFSKFIKISGKILKN
jgi:hypothetical protein